MSGGLCLAGCQTPGNSGSASDKLNVGVIVVANCAGADLREVAKVNGVNIVALCERRPRVLEYGHDRGKDWRQKALLYE